MYIYPATFEFEQYGQHGAIRIWENKLAYHSKSYEIVFYALFLCGHYFIHYGFMQVYILQLFFWKTSFLCLSVLLLPVLNPM